MEAIAGLLLVDGSGVLWRSVPLPLPQRREFMFYLPDGLRPWDDQYVARAIGFFAEVYGRPDSFVAQREPDGRVFAVEDAITHLKRRRIERHLLPIIEPRHPGDAVVCNG
jgi:hypothetical protein